MLLLVDLKYPQQIYLHKKQTQNINNKSQITTNMQIERQELPIILTEDQPIITENSTSLQPIYNKVQQLKRLQLKKQEENKKEQAKFVKVIEELPKHQYIMQIDRRDQFIRRKLQGFETFHEKKIGIEGRQTQVSFLAATQRTKNNFYQTKNEGRKVTMSNLESLLKKRSKSEKMINFLRSTSTSKPNAKTNTPEFIYYDPQKKRNDTEDERESFTPMRPISKISRVEESLSGTSHSKVSGSGNRSSGGYSQVARLSNVTRSNESSTPSKYLRKGHRMRQTLLKQLKIEQDVEQKDQLHYLKEYDQWVPASLAQHKKLELEHFMGILVGSKKVEEKQIIQFKPIYL